MNRTVPLICSCLLFLLTAGLLAYSGGPLPRMTGGFQEQTCHSCHNTFPLNEGRSRGGIFHLTGVPKTYVPGRSYPISLWLGHPGQSRWGFELAVRSAASGRQAGRLVPADETAQVRESGGVQYLQHTASGTREGVVSGPVEFRFNWIAPQADTGAVFFNAAGNAANSSREPSGDYIYTAGAYSDSGREAAPPVRQLTREVAPPRRLEAATLIHLPSPLDRQRGDVEVNIQHRFLDSIDRGPGEAFGIDLGANINLGLGYALTDRLALGISRTRFDKVLALGGSFEIHHETGSFWKMEAAAGVEGESNFERHYSTFLQLPTTFDYRRLRLHLVPTLIFNTRSDQLTEALSDSAINGDDNHTFSLGVGADLALSPTFSLVGEFVPRLAGFGGFFEEERTAAGGVAIRTWGHVFTVVVSTSREFTPSRYGTNGSLTLPNFGEDVALGFNIYRRID